MSSLHIANGCLYDPANNIHGEVKDLYIQDGKFVDAITGDIDKKIDASGLVVMPGGVDIHCHIAGPKVNAARKLQPEDHRHDVHPATPLTRSGTGGTVPSTFTTGYRYATLGYTTAMEAAVTPISARHTIEELDDTPIIDKGFYVLLGNNILLHNLLRENRYEEFEQAMAWWINATKAYTVKLVNPGGDEPWKGRRNSNVANIDDDFNELTPRQIIAAFVKAANQYGFPHPPHIHCNNLGHSGNYKTTLETMKTVGDLRAHLAHIQFHSYGGELNKNPISAAREIIDYINTHPNITCDVGQVMFGKSTIMTADAPLAYMLRNIKKGKWVNADTECESGCGITPFQYQEHVYMHTLQWAIGLELFLMSADPWRVMLSTDHPNGGSFMNYPKLIRLLMDYDFRQEELQLVNQKALAKTALADLKREYTLNEIAIISRAAPARALGLKNKGHLGVGADADITIYSDDANREMMFNAPRYVIKSGQLIISDHEFVSDHIGRLLHISPDFDSNIEATLKPFFEQYYSIEYSNYAINNDFLHDHEVIPLNKP